MSALRWSICRVLSGLSNKWAGERRMGGVRNEWENDYLIEQFLLAGWPLYCIQPAQSWGHSIAIYNVINQLLLWVDSKPDDFEIDFMSRYERKPTDLEYLESSKKFLNNTLNTILPLIACKRIGGKYYVMDNATRTLKISDQVPRPADLGVNPTQLEHSVHFSKPNVKRPPSVKSLLKLLTNSIPKRLIIDLSFLWKFDIKDDTKLSEFSLGLNSVLMDELPPVI